MTTLDNDNTNGQDEYPLPVEDKWERKDWILMKIQMNMMVTSF